MKDFTLDSFLNDISSLSPLVGEYEVNIFSLCMNINLLQKNTNNSIPRNTQENRQILETYNDILISSSKKVFDKFEISNDFVKNYMLAMKMPKTTNNEIKEYENFLNEINKKKILELLVVLNNTSIVLNNYTNCKNAIKSEYENINDLCISIIENTHNYLKSTVQTILSEVDDDEFVFDTLQKIKNI